MMKKSVNEVVMKILEKILTNPDYVHRLLRDFPLDEESEVWKLREKVRDLNHDLEIERADHDCTKADLRKAKAEINMLNCLASGPQTTGGTGDERSIAKLEYDLEQCKAEAEKNKSKYLKKCVEYRKLNKKYENLSDRSKACREKNKVLTDELNKAQWPYLGRKWWYEYKTEYERSRILYAFRMLLLLRNEIESAVTNFISVEGGCSFEEFKMILDDSLNNVQEKTRKDFINEKAAALANLGSIDYTRQLKTRPKSGDSTPDAKRTGNP